MVFNSINFCLFLIVVFVLYYFLFKEKKEGQNWLLLLASYVFYGLSDWKMLPLLLISTTVIYFLGIAVHKAKSHKESKFFTTLGVLVGLGLLFYFKYFNFFIDSFSSLFDKIGIHVNINTFKIIMPLGISFFTFKLISYIVEIHRKKIQPTTNFVVFSTFVSFFPTILSGPIDKPNNFIPQLEQKRVFDYFLTVDGCRQILYGVFLKMVISDNLATVVDIVWKDIPGQSGIILFVTAILYSFQLYTDFSGYSHMAIGVAKLLGIRVTKNFNYPYFARNIAEFWRSWHMSLTTWLTDYVFMPLNIRFRNLGRSGIMLAIIINMIAVGIWHDPKWTYALFGMYNGLIYIPLIISGSFFKKKKMKTNKYDFPSGIDLLKMMSTFSLVTFGFILFRAENTDQAWAFISGIFDTSIPSFKDLLFLVKSSSMVPALTFTLLMLVIEWRFRNVEHPFSKLGLSWKRPYRWALYSFIIFTVFMFMETTEAKFIYFQY